MPRAEDEMFYGYGQKEWSYWSVKERTGMCKFFRLKFYENLNGRSDINYLVFMKTQDEVFQGIQNAVLQKFHEQALKEVMMSR